MLLNFFFFFFFFVILIYTLWIVPVAERGELFRTQSISVCFRVLGISHLLSGGGWGYI